MNEANRWEWRTFARSPAYSGILPAQRAEEIAFTRENYLLSLASPHNVKIRNESLDIKTLIAEDAAGLQQWRPVITARFPIDEPVLDAAWNAWGLPVPVLAKPRCTLDEFLTEIVEPEPALCAVPLEKRRRRLQVEECPGEFVIIQVSGEEWESIAFESLDPQLVWRAVRSLGLENVENASYPAALKKITGFRAVEQTTNREQL